MTDYPVLIKAPMDLGTVKKFILDNKTYSSVKEAHQDVTRVWTNCMTYNADGSDFFILAQTLNKKWENKFKKLTSDLKIKDVVDDITGGQDLAEAVTPVVGFYADLAEDADGVGEMMLALYTQPWDEDESMMRERHRRLNESRDTATSVTLGDREAVLERLSTGDTITFQLSGLNSVPSNLPGVNNDWHNLSHHGKDEKKIGELKVI